jgi:thioredoxin reductase (NADPH)
MAAKSKFIITRKDRVGALDDIVIESEGLTIGRLPSNDLVLNHPWVSRIHAGVKEIGEYFWIFNLSTTNRTLLNGVLVDRAPLADSDVVQIGPYLLRVRYGYGNLAIVVEMELDSQTQGKGVPQPASETEGAYEGTIEMKRPGLAAKEPVIPRVSMGFTVSGLLSGVLPVPEEQALKGFWDKRKREAGKIESESPLRPQSPKTFGKSRFHWVPTLDLRMPWPKAYFAWGAILAGVFSLITLLVYQQALAPGPISSVHASSVSPRGNLALRASQNTCSDCHALTVSMQKKCESCHDIATAKGGRGFQPTIYEKHKRAGMSCVSCHIEHRGPSSETGLVSYGLCSNCHNATYRIRTGEKADQILGIPHGGSVGYPVNDRGQWTWKGLSGSQWKSKNLPVAYARYTAKAQFHTVHQLGRLKNKGECLYCHSQGRPLPGRRDLSARKECGKCHGVTYAAESLEPVKANCNTCHQQHGRSKDLAKLFADPAKVNAYLAGRRVDEASSDTNPGPADGNGVLNLFRLTRIEPRSSRTILLFFGALPWYGWLGLLGVMPLAGLYLLLADQGHTLNALKVVSPEGKQGRAVETPSVKSPASKKRETDAPLYPHPVVNPLLCIGCHACVEACPHDVLAIVNGVATPVSPEQCMEDTACQVECPTSPKACVVLNTTKKIRSQKVPARDKRFKTNVEGIYLIGDISGVPLIKNAINEGAQVIDSIMEDLRQEGPDPKVSYDVAIIGIGPAGLSAAVMAQQRKLRYLAIEQDKVVSTIQNYPAGKYVFFKPETVDAKDTIPLWGVGEQKEVILQAWMDRVLQNGMEIHEEESCKNLKREEDHFTVITEKGKAKDPATYRARKVILAIGNRGTPMKLKVPGEELKIQVEVEPDHPSSSLVLEDKVKYKLTDPDDFVNKRCIVVGAGNAAIEAAVDLAGFRREGDEIKFIRNNEVTLLIRSDLKGDVKLGNKMNLYDCLDAGRVKAYFRTGIKEIKEREVTLMDAKTEAEKARISNDFVFALIGGDKPIKFLEGLGIKIG